MLQGGQLGTVFETLRECWGHLNFVFHSVASARKDLQGRLADCSGAGAEAFIYNAVGVPIAALGLLNPIIAAAVMALSSLSVIVNLAPLKRARLQ